MPATRYSSLFASAILLLLVSPPALVSALDPDVCQATQYQSQLVRLGFLALPNNVHIDYANQPPAPPTVENGLMYIKVRNSTSDLAGVAVFTTEDPGIPKVAWSSDKNHTSLKTAIKSFQSQGANNSHWAYYTTTSPASNSASVNAVNAGTTSLVPGYLYVGPAWNTTILSTYFLSDPLYLQPTQQYPNGTLVVMSNTTIYVLDPFTGAVLYSDAQFADVGLGTSGTLLASGYRLTPVALGSLACFTLGNHTAIAYNVSARDAQWISQSIGTGAFTELQSTQDSLLVRVIAGISIVPVFYTFDKLGAMIKSFSVHPDVGGSSPRGWYPNPPIINNRLHALADVNGSLGTWLYAADSINGPSSNKIEVPLQFDFDGAPPYPAAMSLDSSACRLYILTSSTVVANGTARTVLYVASAQTGQLLYKHVMNSLLDDTEGILLPYVGSEGNVIAISGDEIYLFLAPTAPAPPALPPPPPGAADLFCVSPLWLSLVLLVQMYGLHLLFGDDFPVAR